MKILHIVDADFFERHRKTVSETVLALSDAGLEQEIFTNEGESLGWLSSIVPFSYFKMDKGGRTATLSNRLRVWKLVRRFSPDIVIKWGRGAREIAPQGRFVQVSFLGERENLKRFDKTDYIMTNLDSMLLLAKENGFSGAKSFSLPGFVYRYKDMPPVTRKDFFIPEKARIIYISGNFERGIGWEMLFDAMPSMFDTYFLIAGSGQHEEYVKDYASRVNIKARSRFVPEIERTLLALEISDMALLPFDSPGIAKDILEAQMAKKPVVTIATAVSREFIDDGENGFMVPKGDAYLLRQKIKDVLTMDASEKTKIVDRAYEQVKVRTAEDAASGYVRMFEELVNKYRARRNLLH